MDLNFFLFALMCFLAVVLAVEGIYNLWSNFSSPEVKRIATRLDMLKRSEDVEITLEREIVENRLSWIHAKLESFPQGRRLLLYVKSSGMEATASELLFVTTALTLAGCLLSLLLDKSLFLGVCIGLALGFLPWWRVASQRAARVARFEQQFPEALDLIGRAVRAGHAFPSAIKMCGDEMAEPMGREFRVLSDETNYGVPFQVALQNMARRVPLPDVAYFVVAVMIQRESGGNMAEMLDNISSIVRERVKLHGEIRTLSAEGILSAKILLALPFVLGFFVDLLNPKFLSVLWTDPLGIQMVKVAVFLMIVGVLWMRKLIRIRV